MPFIADLHIHSKYSRATSREADLAGYYRWAQVKGIRLLGTGDFTHPAWFSEISAALTEDGGCFKFAEPPAGSVLSSGSPAEAPVRFILTSEISSIYKKNGETRKVHSLLMVPTLEAAQGLNRRLARIGNIASDGRPILGLDPKDLLEILLEVSPEAMFVPAHIWTPWFSLFGSKSGFDRIEDCFEELTPHIAALETGLSSDPPMNRRWSALDRFRLVSNSDAHSPANLGRESTLFDSEMSFQGIRSALTTGRGFLGTIEFHPEEGKYHADGHRKCGVCMDPEETRKRHEKCPVCGKPLTIGVLNRVLALSDRASAVHPRPSEGFRYRIPLPEILSEICGSGAGSKAVTALYERMIAAFGNEHAVLFEAPVEDISKAFGGLAAEAVKRMREGRVSPTPGYDGEFGRIGIFEKSELDRLRGQDELFTVSAPRARGKRRETAALPRKRRAQVASLSGVEPQETLDAGQEEIASASSGISLVCAGPGTGKTRILTHWIARRIGEGAVGDGEALAVTFTNKAASEMRRRLAALPAGAAGEAASGRTHVCTFHSLCHSILQEHGRPFRTVYGSGTRPGILRIILPADLAADAAGFSGRMERFYEGMDAAADPATAEAMRLYEEYLKKIEAADLSALAHQTTELLKTGPEIRESLRRRFRVIAVDELQDINLPQYGLLLLLAGPEYGEPPAAMLCIGDPDQAIYSFRGSDRSLFFRLRDELGAGEYSLTRTYRSVGPIIRSAEAVVSAGPGVRAPLVPVRLAGLPIAIHAAADPGGEGSFIAETVRRLVGGTDSISADESRDETGGYSFQDIAVLFRTRAVRDALLPSFMRSGIPATVAEASPIHAQRPFSYLIAALRLILNPRDVASLAELLAHLDPGGTPRTAAEVLSGASKTAEIPDLLLARGVISADSKARLEPIFAAPDALPSMSISGIMDAILQTTVRFDRAPPETALGEELLRDAAAAFGADLRGYLRQLSLLAVESEEAVRAERVSLLTFHAAKGLEFPVVFIAGAEEGLVPMPDDIEEERRLFYVALTRGQDRVFVSHCAERQVRGEWKKREPSRFLGDIPEECRESTVRKRKKKDAGEGQLALF